MQENSQKIIDSPSKYLPTLSSNDFCWKLESEWTPEQQNFFHRARGLEPRKVFSKSTQDTNSNANSLKSLGKWVLGINDASSGVKSWEDAKAFAECQGSFGTFSILHLLVGFQKPNGDDEDSAAQHNSWSVEMYKEALSYLITAVSIACNPDEIKLFTEDKNAMTIINEFGWGESSKIWSPIANEALTPMGYSSRFSNHLTIDTRSWAKTKIGEKRIEDLAYLEKRKMRMDAQAGCSTCPEPAPKRSLLARIFRPKV